MIAAAGVDYRSLRSVLETPILDRHKWAKVSGLPADAVLLDIEDSVPPQLKLEARERVVDELRNPGRLGSKLALPRVNSLETEWGHGDLEAVARAGASAIVYPKLRSAQELTEAKRILASEGAEPDLLVVVETARALIELESIARVDGLRGFLFGPSDLAVDAGISLFGDDGLNRDAYHYPKSKLVLTAAAYGLAAIDIVFVPDIRDLERVRRELAICRRLGFTGCATFYPPHLDAINETFSPSSEELDQARSVVEAYEHAVKAGAAAVKIEGRALIVQDYKRALAVLEKERARDGLR